MQNSDNIKIQISNMNLNYLGSISYDNNLEENIGKPEKLLKTRVMDDLNIIIKRINFYN